MFRPVKVQLLSRSLLYTQTSANNLNVSLEYSNMRNNMKCDAGTEEDQYEVNTDSLRCYFVGPKSTYSYIN